MRTLKDINIYNRVYIKSIFSVLRFNWPLSWPLNVAMLCSSSGAHALHQLRAHALHQLWARALYQLRAHALYQLRAHALSSSGRMLCTSSGSMLCTSPGLRVHVLHQLRASSCGFFGRPSWRPPDKSCSGSGGSGRLFRPLLELIRSWLFQYYIIALESFSKSSGRNSMGIHAGLRAVI